MKEAIAWERVKIVKSFSFVQSFRFVKIDFEAVSGMRALVTACFINEAYTRRFSE